MEEEKKEITAKVDEIIKVTDEDTKAFERRKIQLERDVQLDIISYLRDRLKTNSDKSKLAETLLKEIQSYFEDEEKRKEIGFVHLLKLLEIVNKSENELSLGIMNIVSNRINKDTPPESNDNRLEDDNSEDDDLSKESVQNTKKRYQLFKKFEGLLEDHKSKSDKNKDIDDLKNSEFNENEDA